MEQIFSDLTTFIVNTLTKKGATNMKQIETFFFLGKICFPSAISNPWYLSCWRMVNCWCRDAPVALTFYLTQIYELMAAYQAINYPLKLISIMICMQGQNMFKRPQKQHKELHQLMRQLHFWIMMRITLLTYRCNIHTRCQLLQISQFWVSISCHSLSWMVWLIHNLFFNMRERT
jgi:hypothetical protein